MKAIERPSEADLDRFSAGHPQYALSMRRSLFCDPTTPLCGAFVVPAAVFD